MPRASLPWDAVVDDVDGPAGAPWRAPLIIPAGLSWPDAQDGDPAEAPLDEAHGLLHGIPGELGRGAFDARTIEGQVGPNFQTAVILARNFTSTTIFI